MDALTQATQLGDPTRRTPREIDTVVAALTATRTDLHHAIGKVIDSMHHAIGDSYTYYGRVKVWATTASQAVAAFQTAITNNTVAASHRRGAPNLLATYNTLTATLATVNTELARLDVEYDRRGRWTRFVICVHIHSGHHCAGGTLDRGQYESARTWLIDYSGMDEAAAIAHLADRAEALCTHCFPHAPVRPATIDPTQCPGSGKPINQATARTGYAAGNYATCGECGTRKGIGRIAHVMPKHPRPVAPKAKPGEITTPDGGFLHEAAQKRDGTFRDGDRIKTPVAARNRALAELFDARWYGADTQTAESKETVRRCVAALAAHHDRPEADVLAELQGKTEKKYQREMKSR